MTAFSLAMLLLTCAADMPSIAAHWNEMHEEVLSAHVKFTGYRIWDRNALQPVTKEMVIALGQSMESMTVEQRAAAFEEWLVPAERGRRALKVEQWTEGKRLRENARDDVIHDGERDLIREPDSRRVAIYNRGGARHGVWSLRDLRVIPKVNDDDYKISSATAAQTTIERIKDQPNGIKNIGSQITYDNATFIPRLMVLIRNGKVRTVNYQGAARPKGPNLPAFVIQAEFGIDGQIIKATSTFLESATFNEPISDRVFQAEAAQGWTILDERSTPGRSIVLEHNVTDAVAAMNEVAELPPPEQPEPVIRLWKWWHGVFLAIGIFATASALWFFVLKARKKSPSAA